VKEEASLTGYSPGGVDARARPQSLNVVVQQVDGILDKLRW
jgi:hypothetical protein